VTTSDAQMIARAIQDALTGATLKALQAAAEAVKAGATSGEAVAATLGADAPREVRSAVVALAAEGRLNTLPAVLQAYERATSRGGSQVLDANVTSAVALGDADQAAIVADLRGKYGESLVVHFDIDESLIGGLIVRVGDQVLDNSLRARLSAVQRSMLTS